MAIYVSSVRNDGSEWGLYPGMYMGAYPLSVGMVTLPGCKNGCGRWTPQMLSNGFYALNQAIQTYQCVLDETFLLYWAESAPADLAMLFFGTPELDNADGVLAVSPGGFIGPSLAEELAPLRNNDRQTVVVFGGMDPQVSQWNQLIGASTVVNGFQIGIDGNVTIIGVPDSADHARNLYSQELADLIFADGFESGDFSAWGVFE